MAGTHKSVLVVLLVVVAAVIAGTGALLLLGSEDPNVPTDIASPSSAPSSPRAPEADVSVQAPEVAEERDRSFLRRGESSVAWPVEVHLELRRAANFPSETGVAAIGSGRLASVRGRVANAVGNGVAATIAFVAGPNEGRELRCHPDGRFGATDLYPGLNLVKISGPGIPGAERELRLRRHKTSELNIGFGLPGGLAGTVYDEKGDPLPEVRVELEGRYTNTNEDGIFFIEGVAPGLDIQLKLSKDGYADYSERVSIAARFVLEDQKYRMQKAAKLRIVAPNAIGGPGLAKVFLLPEDANQGRDYPWYSVNPVLVRPGGQVVVDRLPPKRIKLRIFHEGARAKPKVQIANLVSGRETITELGLEAAPSIAGVITDPQGLAVPGATVRLEAPDRTAAALTFLGQMPAFLETEIMPTLPVSVQEVQADGQGRFVLSAWSEFAPTRYLIAESPDGRFGGSRLVRADDSEVDLQLAPIAEGRGTLSLRFPGRWQGLPVEVFVQGAPRGLTLLEVGDPLELEDLAEGIWRMRATWHGRSIIVDPKYLEFEVKGTTIQELSLPTGAIDGQDSDTLLRAKAPWAPDLPD